MTQIKVLDTSKWEGRRVDYAVMKAQGISGVIMKASDSNGGVCYTDAVYKEESADARGILPRGSFHFLDRIGSGKSQAQYYWSVIKESAEEISPCLDVEGYPYGDLPSGAELVALCMDFLVEIERLSGRIPLLYANTDMIKRMQLKPGDPILRYFLWLSHPDPTPPVAADYYPWPEVVLWQFTYKEDAHHYGIADAVAVDANYIDSEDLGEITTPGTGGVTVTNAFKDLPKLIYIWEAHNEMDLAALGGNIDGLIALAVDRTRTKPFDNTSSYISPMFTTQINWANELRPSVPCVAMVCVDPGEYVNFPLEDESRWPGIDSDPVMVDVKRAIMTATGGKLKVTGIIFDMRKLTEGTTSKIVSAGRITRIATHLQKLAWDNLKVYTMVLTNDQVLKQAEYQDSQSKAELSNFFMAHDDQYQSAVGECIQFTDAVVEDSLNGIHFPLPCSDPNPHTPYAPSGNKLLLWWFSSLKLTAVKANGVAAFVVTFVSRWAKKDLYSAWGFTPITDGTTIPTEDPGNDGIPISDFTAAEILKLKSMAAHWKD